jgi:ribonuclease HII
MLKKLPEWIKINQGLNFEDIEIIVDGNKVPDIKGNIRSEVKADKKFPEVMAASILAKVHRDRIMDEYDKLYPEYFYGKHKGYPTPMHKEICRQIGPSPIQRLSFKY